MGPLVGIGLKIGVFTYTITQAISKQRTDLQVALSNFVKRKHLIEELHHFGITSTYDEFLLFKGSAAYAATENSQTGCATTEDNHRLVQGISDNFACNISSQNDLKQTQHGCHNDTRTSDY